MKQEKYPPVSVVMVGYNEAKTIQEVLTEYYRDVYKKLPKGSEFIFYADKPTDGTSEIIAKLAKKYRIKLIVGKKNLGYAGAMKSALARAKNDLIFYSDSSGKHRASDFWSLLPFSVQYDIVTGDRQNRTDPYIRQLVTMIARMLVVVFFGLPFHDYNTGFKLVHKKVLTRCLKKCRYAKQSFSTELLVRAHRQGFSIVDVPVSFTDRKTSGQGTNYAQLPKIVFAQTKALLLLRSELRERKIP